MKMINRIVHIFDDLATYPSPAPEFTPGFLVGSMLLIFLGFFVLSYVSLHSEFHVVMSGTISA